jgi:hypothetical protein
VRGGKRAYDARLRSESVMEAAIEAAADEHGAAPARPAPDDPAQAPVAAQGKTAAAD